MFIGMAQMWCFKILLHTVLLNQNQNENQNQLYRSSMQTLVFPLLSVYLIELNLLENNNINNNKLHRLSVSLLSHTTRLWLYKRGWMNHMSNCWCSDGCLLQVSALCISQS